MSSPAARPTGDAPAALPVFPDEILEEIFVRLDAAADLARASAACTTFRRVVSARRIRRRFRSLHPAPILGILESDAPRLDPESPEAFHPAEPPHRSAGAARALAQAADFTFSFLDTPNCWQICDSRDGRVPNCWQICDSRDGRVLLYRPRSPSATAFPHLVVCDPLHRRHVQLPRIPDDLVAATGGWGYQEFDRFLDPATDKEKEEEDLAFRVICAVLCQRKLVTFHFSSVTGKWRVITFDRPTPWDPSMFIDYESFERHYAHSCFYWRFPGTGSLFILDAREMKFSVVDQGPGSGRFDSKGQAIVEVGENRLGIVSLGNGVLELYSKTLGNNNNGVDTDYWQHDNNIPLPQMHCSWSILGSTEGYLLLKATPWSHIQYITPISYFTLDLKTLLVERLYAHAFWLDEYIEDVHLYASFPPLLSPPSI